MHTQSVFGPTEPARTGTLHKAARARGRLARWSTPYLFILPAAIALATVYVFPMARAVSFSFQHSDMFTAGGFAGLANYQSLLGTAEVRESLAHSLVWVVGSVAGQMGVGILVALLLNERWRGNRLVRVLVLIPWVMPGVVLGLDWRLMYEPNFGMINDLLRRVGMPTQTWLADPQWALLAVIVPNIWKAFPFVTVTMLAGLTSIPSELYDAAKVDGAHGPERFLYITLPSLRNLLAVTSLLMVVWTFNYFDLPFVLTGGGPANATEVTPILVYRFAFENFQFGLSSALAVFMTVVNGIFAVLYLRLLRREV